LKNKFQNTSGQAVGVIFRLALYVVVERECQWVSWLHGSAMRTFLPVCLCIPVVVKVNLWVPHTAPDQPQRTYVVRSFQRCSGFLQVREKLEKVTEFEWSGKFFWRSQGKWKIGATRCEIFRLKCIKFDFHWGSAPDPAGGAYSAPPDPLAALSIAP